MPRCVHLNARYVRAFATPDLAMGHAYESLDICLESAALLLVDVYDGVQGGEVIEGVADAEVQRYQATIDRIAVALHHARDVGFPVVYASNSAPRIEMGRSRFAEHFRRSWGQDPSQLFREGGLDEREFHGGRPGPLAYPTGLEPSVGDYYVRKHVYSAFFDTRLDSLLRHRNVDTLIMAGFWADTCMAATALDALYRNYRVIWLRDATLGDEERAIAWFEEAVGYSATVADFVSAEFLANGPKDDELGHRAM